MSGTGPQGPSPEEGGVIRPPGEGARMETPTPPADVTRTVDWGRVVPAGGLVVTGLALLASHPWVGGPAAAAGFVALHFALKK